jgi:Leucine-rich repeat (LRR) protein
MFQKLDLSFNLLRSLPDELSSFRTLEELALRHNEFPEAPVFALRGMTAITKIDLSYQSLGGDEDAPAFQVPSPLLPILHPGLVELNLEQARRSLDASGWDPISLVHLGRAMVEVSDRMPVLTLLLDKL